jgi:hypothetical protein
MSSAPATAEPAFGDDLAFTLRPRESCGGTWVLGLVAGRRFQALVFPGHAEGPGHELEESRISKLWVQRLSDRTVVFNFDRGEDLPARDHATRAVVEFLAGALANRVFG